jgi:hypothetical protein
MADNPYESSQSESLPTSLRKSHHFWQRLRARYRRFQDYAEGNVVLVFAFLQVLILFLVFAALHYPKSIRAGINLSIVNWLICFVLYYPNRGKTKTDSDPLE